VAVVLGGVVALLARNWLASHAQSNSVGTIVVAAVPLAVGTQLTAENLREIPWATWDLPDGTYATRRDVLRDGPHTVLASIARNEPILRDKLTIPGQIAISTALLPSFPWPPPAASAWYVLPQSLFGSRETIGEETAAIISALERNGYVERSFYGTPAPGVALITRLERINDDGSPADPSNRWPNDRFRQDTSSLADFLKGLFYADPGRYRVIVFIIQDQPFVQSTDKILTAEQAEKLLPGGDNVLPPDVAVRSASNSQCTALIYEFTNDGSGIRLVARSRLTGQKHLEEAGLLVALQKSN
jgi:hypothetical protein